MTFQTYKKLFEETVTIFSVVSLKSPYDHGKDFSLSTLNSLNVNLRETTINQISDMPIQGFFFWLFVQCCRTTLAYFVQI